MRALVLAVALVAGCTTLPGYQGGPHPRSTQTTGIGGVPAPGAHPDALFAYEKVFQDGSHSRSTERFEARESCEASRQAYVASVVPGSVLTTKCFQTHGSAQQGAR